MNEQNEKAITVEDELADIMKPLGEPEEKSEVEPENGKGRFPGAGAYEFSYYNAPVKNTTPRGKITLAMMLEFIQDGMYKHLTDKIRGTKNEDTQQQLKVDTLPYVNIAGVFETRGNETILRHSGLLCLDLDHLTAAWTTTDELKEKFKNDEYVYAAFVSPRNDGLKIILRVPLIEKPPLKIDGIHKKYFDLAERHVWEKYHLKVDKGTRDVSRATFMSYDPTVYFNEGAEVFTGDEIGQVESSAGVPDGTKDDGKTIIKAGGRNNFLIKVAGSFRRSGLSDEALFQALWAINQKRCDLPLDEKEVRTIAKSAERYKNEETPEEVIEATESGERKKYELTQMGNGERMADLLNGEGYFCYELSQWVLWNRAEKKWVWDVEKKIKEFYKNVVVHDIWQDLMNFPEVKAKDKQAEDNLKALTAFHKAAQNKIHADLSIASCSEDENKVKIQMNKIDKHPTWLSVANGVIDLETGRLMDNKPEYFLTRNAPVVYDPLADCPWWKKEVELFFSGKKDKIAYFKKLCGYALTSGNRSKIFPILIGAKNTGKSLFIKMMYDLLGNDLCGSLGKENIIISKHGSDYKKDEFVSIVGRRVVFSVETDEQDTISEALVKAWTGGDPFKFRRLNSNEWFKSPLTSKLFLVTNYEPRITGQDSAIWERVKKIVFEHVFDEKEKIETFYEDYLKPELPGILNWMVEGAMEYFAMGGMGKCEEVDKDSRRYMLSQNPVALFFRDNLKKEKNSKIPSSELYNKYKEYAEANGERYVGQKKFTQSMKSLGVGIERVNKGKVFVGVKYASNTL